MNFYFIGGSFHHHRERSGIIPVIARFYGMVIKMYFRQSEHNPPHIHAIYGECVGVIDIRTGEMLEGDLSKRALKMVQEWVKQHENDLIKIWETQKFVELPPLE
ncbi:DUF4160 domain-containing protein [Blautia wexlerae]